MPLERLEILRIPATTGGVFSPTASAPTTAKIKAITANTKETIKPLNLLISSSVIT